MANTGQFAKVIVTAAGKAMIAKSQGGQTLTFTRVALGDGLILEGEDPVNYTSVKNERLSVPIAKFNNLGNGQFEIQFRITNQDVTTGFWHREIGVMAKIDNGTEELYAYTTAGNAGSYIYDKTTPVEERVVNVMFVVGNADNLEVMIDNSIIYVTKKDFDAAMDKHEKNDSAHLAAISKHNKDLNAHSTFVGASASAAGKRGMVPAPAQNKQNAVLAGNGEWKDADSIDMTPVGDVVFRPFLKAGYVKANGATVNRADYPRLVAFATANNLWTTNPANEPWKFGQGNGSTTMVLPNYVGRFIQGGDSSAVKAAGLPNITGKTYSILSQLPSESGALAGSEKLPADTGLNAETIYAMKLRYLEFNASRSNPIYGNSTTVQPPSLQLIPQIRY